MVDLTSLYPFGINRKNWPMFAIGLALLLGVMLFSDHPISLLVTKQSADVINLFNQVTRWGESDWILIPSGALLIISAIVARLLPQRTSKLALIEMIEVYALIFVGVGLPGLVADIVKHLVGRSRPVVFDQVGILGFHPIINDYGFQSWPSGHTTTAFALAMVIGFLSPKWFGLGLLYAFAVAASRLVLGAHYPTDVLSGAVLGSLGAYAVRNYFARRRWGFERRADGHVIQRPMVGISRLARRFQRKPAQ
jgi:membrane-associated phospholipid phosphatase